MSPSGWRRASRIRNTVVNFRRYACCPLFQGSGAGRITGKVIESIPEKCGIKRVDAALLDIKLCGLPDLFDINSKVLMHENVS